MCQSANYCQHISCISFSEENKTDDLSILGPMSQAEEFKWTYNVINSICLQAYNFNESPKNDNLVTISRPSEQNLELVFSITISDGNDASVSLS